MLSPQPCGLTFRSAFCLPPYSDFRSAYTESDELRACNAPNRAAARPGLHRANAITCDHKR